MLALSQCVIAADYTIDTDVTTTNGGNTLDGNDSLTVTESGSITTNGTRGVETTGMNNTVANFGSVTTLTDSEAGIHAADDNNTFSNYGSVTTQGNFSEALYVESSNNTVNNFDSISTQGNDSFGIYAEGSNNTVDNSGSISTEGEEAHGIYAEGSNNTVNNSGSINTEGDDAFGIYLESNSNKATNTGIITTSGDRSDGIYSDSDNAVITNSGTISTSGDRADGIFSEGANTTITNSGLIYSAQDDGVQIDNGADNVVIINSGTIISLQETAIQISDAPNTVINNSGVISGNSAILGGADMTLNLSAGSRVLGTIDLDDDGSDVSGDTVNIYGGSPSAQTTFTSVFAGPGAGAINLYGAGIINGTTVTTVDATIPTAQGLASAGLSNSVHGTINQRMAYKPSLQPVQVASLGLSSGDLFQQNEPTAWAQAFGGKRERDAEGDVMAYDHSHYGVNFGYEWDVQDRRVGLMAGFARSDVESDITSFDTETDSFYVGGYGHFDLGSINLTASLIGGYSDYDHKRYVFDNENGLETANSDFDGTFLSPSVTVSAAYPLKDGFELRPSLNLAYNIAWIDDYSESGTTSSNLNIDDTTARTLSTRLQLAIANQPSRNSEVEMRIGLTSRHSDNDKTHAVLSGSSFSFDSAGDDNELGGYVGFNYRVATKDNLHLVADLESGVSDDETYIQGQLSLEYKF